MTEIYIVRHGESEGNLFCRVHGVHDGHLTAMGHRQAAKAAAKLKDVKFTAAYSSCLKRAASTAEEILKYHPGVELRLTPRIRELGVGIWEDKNWGQVYSQTPDMLDYYHDRLSEWHVQGSEWFEDARARAIGLIREIGEKHKNETVLVTCHGYVIRAIIAEIRGIPSSEIKKVGFFGNTSITKLNISDSGEIEIEYENDISHLDGGDEKGPLSRRPAYGKFNNVIIENLNPSEDEEFFRRIYPDGDFEKIKKMLENNPRAAGKFVYLGQPSGLIVLDMQRDKAKCAAWIDYYYVDEEHRGTGVSKALIGHAISALRPLFYEKICVKLPKDDEALIKYFDNYAFEHEYDEGDSTVLAYDLMK